MKRRSERFERFRKFRDVKEGSAGQPAEEEGPIPVSDEIRNLFAGPRPVAPLGPPPPGGTPSAPAHPPLPVPAPLPISAPLPMPPMPAAVPVALAPVPAPHPFMAPAAPDVSPGGMTRMVEELKTLRKLQEVFAALSAETTLDGFYETTLDLAMALSRTEDGIFAGQGGRGFEAFAAKAYGDQPMGGQDLQVAVALCRHVFERGQEIWSNDYATDGRFQQMPRGSGRLHSFLIVPLVTRRSVLGVVFLGNYHVIGAYTERDRAFYQGFCQQAGIAFANLLAHAEQEEEARRQRAEMERLEGVIREREKRIADLQRVSLEDLFPVPLDGAEKKFRQRYFRDLLRRNAGDVERSAAEAGLRPNKLLDFLKESGLNVRQMSEEEAQEKADAAGMDQKAPVLRKPRRRKF